MVQPTIGSPEKGVEMWRIATSILLSAVCFGALNSASSAHASCVAPPDECDDWIVEPEVDDPTARYAVAAGLVAFVAGGVVLAIRARRSRARGGPALSAGSLRMIGWVAAGLVVLGLVMGMSTWVEYLGAASSVEEPCPGLLSSTACDAAPYLPLSLAAIGVGLVLMVRCVSLTRRLRAEGTRQMSRPGARRDRAAWIVTAAVLLAGLAFMVAVQALVIAQRFTPEPEYFTVVA